MIAQRARTPHSRRDVGFTLIEVMITTAIIGLITAVIGATIMVILQTQPRTEARVDDARSLLGLTTYLPEDINSTPPGGLDFPASFAAADARATGCAENTVAGVSLVHLTWTENLGPVNTYIANYRYVDNGGGPRIYRYACVNGGPESTQQMTSKLPPLGSWAPQVDPAPRTAPVDFRPDALNGMRVAVTTVEGDVLTLSMRSNNPSATLPPSPPVVYPPAPPTNVAPTAPNVNTTTALNTAKTIFVPATDPNAGDALTITRSGVPAGWTATPIPNSLRIVVSPPAAGMVGDVATFNYTATDPYGASATGTITVTLTATPTNTPPTAGPVSQQIDANSPTSINLPASDVDGDVITITLSALPAGISSASVSGVVLTVTADGTTANPLPITYTVNDGRGGTASNTITLTVRLCAVTSLTPTSVSRAAVNGTRRLVNPITYTVSYTGPCSNLVLQFDPRANGSIETLSFASATSVTILGQAPPGPGGWTMATHNVVLKNGAAGPVLRTVTITVTN